MYTVEFLFGISLYSVYIYTSLRKNGDGSRIYLFLVKKRKIKLNDMDETKNC